jgi:hypothetical protein
VNYVLHVTQLQAGRRDALTKGFVHSYAGDLHAPVPYLTDALASASTFTLQDAMTLRVALTCDGRHATIMAVMD